jgi:outer membrane receptor for ferrienterochelin and colicins
MIYSFALARKIKLLLPAIIGGWLMVLSLQLAAQSPESISLRIKEAGGQVLAGVQAKAGEKLLGVSSKEGILNLPSQAEGIIGLYLQGFDPVYLTLSKTSPMQMEIIMQKSPFDLETLVVTGQRREQRALESNVPVSTVKRETLRFSLAADLAEGLRFTPGVRVENNCSNCGFTQVRLNGLDGPYTQVLINSRPVFSALSAVYGLEHIHPEMIERVEVVRGGGSAMYGSNAIAGTLNILTRMPSENAIHFGSTFQTWGRGTTEQQYNALLTRVSDDATRGLMTFLSARNRDAYDRDGDGYTELPELQNINLATRGYLQLQGNWILEANAAYLQEHRRGGSDLEEAPDFADLAEEIRHRIFSMQISADKSFAGGTMKWGNYAGFQYVDRASYYGAGGNAEVLRAEGLGEEAIRASLEEASLFFGNTYDHSAQLGTQLLIDKAKFTHQLGIESMFNTVTDEMPGYGRSIDQEVGTLAFLGHSEYRISKQWEAQAGARLDLIQINGHYLLEDEGFRNSGSFSTLNPRINVAFRPNEQNVFRAGMSRGFRAPQAFDEDLHIDLVGGEALFIRLSDDLRPESSLSYQLRYDQQKKQSNFGIEAFFTKVHQPFVNVLIREESPGILQKQNAEENAQVFGMHAESNWRWGSNWQGGLGGTLQAARYSGAVDVADELSTERILRTPNLYGYAQMQWQPHPFFNLRSSLNLTGPMDVIYQGILRDVQIERTPAFTEIDLMAAYTKAISSSFILEFQAGIRNLTNAFQEDFESGRDRDAGYMFGPMRPRMFTLGLSMKVL